MTNIKGDVNGDVTPVTHQPIERVDAADWNNCSVADLTAQKVTLQQRLVYVQQRGSVDMIKAIKKGIDRLDLIINSKRNNDVGLL